MNRKRAETLVRNAFSVLAAEFYLMHRIADAAADGERRHRRGDFRRFHPRAASVDTCAKFFAVKFVLDYATGETQLPGIADASRLRQDALLSASLVAEYGGDRILGTLREAGIDPAEVLALDYGILIGEAKAPA